jgi:nucleoside-diphosphate-sugar epimerase
MAVSLVIGGAGFVGSHLVESLLRRDWVVRVLDNFTTGNLTNLARVLYDIELYPGDLSDRDFLHRVMCGVELVFYQATPSRASAPFESYSAYSTPALDLIRIMTAARETNVRRVIAASSCRVYGQRSCRPCREDNLTQPTDRYGMAKLAEERVCSLASSFYGVETVRLRYFNVYGPRQPRTGPYARLIPQVVDAMLESRPPVIAGGPNSGQDLIYIDDVIQATLLAAETPRVTGKVYNIGRGRPTTAAEMVATCNDLLGTHIEPYYAPGPTADVGPVAEISSAEVDLGFCPTTTLAQGLQRSLAGRTALCHR